MGPAHFRKQCTLNIYISIGVETIVWDMTWWLAGRTIGTESNPPFLFSKKRGAINSNNSRPLCVFGLSVFKKTNDNKIQRPLDANTLVIYLLFFTKIYYLPHLPAFSRSAFCLCPPRSFYLRCYEKRASQLPRTGLPFDQKIFKKLSVHIDETLSGWPALKDNQSMCRAVRSP